uniref:Bacterial recombinase A n=1 Tax=Schizoplasmodiopsis vulgaris TaxID=435421 RepID=A0A3G1FLJ8_9EUKA|nr:bacterial recombinase A [Schizoplasmodiopsis vulgaris]
MITSAVSISQNIIHASRRLNLNGQLNTISNTVHSNLISSRTYSSWNPSRMSINSAVLSSAKSQVFDSQIRSFAFRKKGKGDKKSKLGKGKFGSKKSKGKLANKEEDEEEDNEDSDTKDAGNEKPSSSELASDSKSDDANENSTSKSTKKSPKPSKKSSAKDDAIEETSKKSQKTGKSSKDTTAADDNLESAIKSIETTFGKGTVMKLGETGHNVDVISTGSLGLDAALGIGGVPKGRIIEIFGPESSGKTTLALSIIAQSHKAGGKCAIIDAEHALDPAWARKLGVNTKELLVCQPDNGEQALDIADMLISSGSMDVVVIDSVAALVPRAELEGEMGDFHIGAQARLMLQALRKLTGTLGKNNKTVLIFINQIRLKIGVMFGNPETTTGGTALKYYSSARLDIRKTTQIKHGDHVVGNQIKVKVVKNKLSAPFREAIFDLEYSKGISKIGELVDFGVKTRLLEKQGAWYSYKGTKVAQGREKTKTYFLDNPDIAQELESTIREKLLTDNNLLEIGSQENTDKEATESIDEDDEKEKPTKGKK